MKAINTTWTVCILAIALLMLPSQAGAIFHLTFEEGYGRDGQIIDDIAGVEFVTTDGYDWIYGDGSTLNYNTFSIDGAYSNPGGGYGHYGNVFAFLGTDYSAAAGIIDFSNDDGTWFSIGYASASDFYLEGFDGDDNKIAEASGEGNYGASDMGWLTITAPGGQKFDYVKIHDNGNYFLVDEMQGDASGVMPIPEASSALLLIGGSLIAGTALRRKMRG